MDWLKKLFPKYRCNTGGLKLLGIFIFLSPFFIWPITQVRAATAGPNSPSTNTEDSSVGTVNWNHPDYDHTSDDNYATSQGNMSDGEATVYLKATNFGFSIPAGATIDGISVNVERQANDASFFDNAIRIVKGGVVGTTDGSSGDVWPTSDGTVTYGGASDLWGETWTDTDINGADFGFAISVKKIGGSKNKKPSIDWINITVVYTPPDTAAPSVPGIPEATIGTNLTSQNWSWAASTDIGSGVSHYDWRADSVPSGTTYFGTAATPMVTTNLTRGIWRFFVKAEDNFGNQSAESSSLLAVFSSSIQEIAVDCSDPSVQIITPSDISTAVLDLSPLTVPVGDFLEANINCKISLKTLLPSAAIAVDIPVGTVIKGPATSWTKVIIPPLLTTTTTLLPAPSGFSSQVALAIKIGHDIAPLDITKGARIFIEGQAGKKVGYISNNVFTEITSTCTDDSQTVGDTLAAGGNCKIDSASDLVLWTKHFTEFVTYDLVSSSTTMSSNNSSSSSSSSVPGCGDQAPGAKAPWLYGAIAQDSNSILLYFTKADNPVNKYVLEFGAKSGDYPYGVQDMGVNSRSQMTYLVKSLSPNTTYYFRVRGGNGCATGPWSNEISAKTKGLVSFNQLEITQSELESRPVEEACQTYRVKSGDTLWSIAKNILGDGKRYRDIIEQNKDQYPSLNNSNNVSRGWKLKINCEIEPKTAEETQSQQGYNVKIKILDSNKKPVEGAKITLHSKIQEAKTNKDGIAEFKNVEQGEHRIIIAYNNYEGEQMVNLTGNVKEFDLNVSIQPKNIFLARQVIILIALLILVIFILSYFLFKEKRK